MAVLAAIALGAALILFIVDFDGTDAPAHTNTVTERNEPNNAPPGEPMPRTPADPQDSHG
ncbi:hypothetical protein C5O27_02650 [Gordonia alkanivorans]|nr:hypothetical protein C5O27_02650 [Gordonia alkanivorans]